MTMVCFVMFSDQASFDPYAFRAAAETALGGTLEVDSLDDQGEGVYQLDLVGNCEGGGSPGAVFVSEMPALDLGAEESAGYLWPDATEQLKRHQSHWIVTTALCECSAVDEAMLLTRVTNAILKTHPTALGVLWHQHGLKVSSENFQEIVDCLQPGELPVSLWVDISVVPAEDAPVLALTSGMDSFGLMEIENVGAPEPPDELHARILGVCDYLLHNGPILNHGDTLGETATEKIRVFHAKSMFGREGKVIHLHYGDGQGAAAKMNPMGSAPTGSASLGSGSLGSAPGSSSPWLSLAVLAGCLLMIGVMIFAMVKGVGWVTAQLRPDPIEDPMPWANVADDQTPVNPDPSTGPDRSASPNQSGNPAHSNPAVSSPTASSIENDTRDSNDADQSPSERGDPTPAQRDPTDPFEGNPSPAVNPFEVDRSSAAADLEDPFVPAEPPKTPSINRKNSPRGDGNSIPDASTSTERDEVPAATASGNPFQVDPTHPDPERESSDNSDTASENPFQVDPSELAGNTKLPKVGDKVRVQWGSRWWDGEIIAIENNQYKFSYDGWSSNWDEWKSANELRWPDDTPVEVTP